MEKKTGRLVGRLRLTHPTQRPEGGVVVGVDVQADGMVLVGDGTGVGLPDVDLLHPSRVRHAPGLYHRRALPLAQQVEAMQQEVSRMRRVRRVATDVAQRRVAQAHGYGSWAELMQAANP